MRRLLRYKLYTVTPEISDWIDYILKDIENYEDLTKSEKEIISEDWFDNYTAKVYEEVKLDHCEISSGGTELISSAQCPTNLGFRYIVNNKKVIMCVANNVHTCEYFDKVIYDNNKFNIICTHPQFKHNQ